MAISLLEPFNKIIYQTTTEILDSQITRKAGDVLNTLLTSGIEVIEDTLKEIQDITKDTNA